MMVPAGLELALAAFITNFGPFSTVTIVGKDCSQFSFLRPYHVKLFCGHDLMDGFERVFEEEEDSVCCNEKILRGCVMNVHEPSHAGRFTHAKAWNLAAEAIAKRRNLT